MHGPCRDRPRDDTTDFFYTCPVHPIDRGLAKRALDSGPKPKKPSVSPEVIAKVKRGSGPRKGTRYKDGQDAAEGAREGDGKDAELGTKVDSA